MKPIKRFVEGGYIQADTTGTGHWEIGRILRADKTHVTFLAVDGMEIRVGRQHAYKATEKEYRDAQKLAKGLSLPDRTAQDRSDGPKETSPVAEESRGDTTRHTLTGSGLEDEGQDEEGEDEEGEEGASSDVVSLKYRLLYAARGNRSHCGDWLAQTLAGAFPVRPGTKNPGFDYTEFSQCLIDNGVDMTGPWAELPTSETHGWQGRYRMNGRQKLELRLVETGVLVLHRRETPVPEDALEELRIKHGESGRSGRKS